MKLLQEVITLCVFVPFAYFYLKEPLKLDYLWAALCILGAVFSVFRSKGFGQQVLLYDMFVTAPLEVINKIIQTMQVDLALVHAAVIPDQTNAIYDQINHLLYDLRVLLQPVAVLVQLFQYCAGCRPDHILIRCRL